MKRLFTIIPAVLLTATIWAQSPQKMSYQAVIRNSLDQLVTNHAVGMRISILQGSSSGTVVYTETQTPTTNANGLVSIEIGGGAGFDAINWANYTFFIKTETDPLGGTNYSITGTSQLLSVPYALYAKTVASYPETDPIFGAWNKSTGINITALQVSDFQTTVTHNAAVLLNTAKNSYPSADATKLAAITGTNTGDETTATIKTKLGITTLSGSNTGDQTLSGLGGVASNTAITGATKTKITYDTKGLVTSGTDATTADIAASTDKNYVTDAQLTEIGNTSGTNTGDQNLASVLTQGTDAGNKKIINVNQQGIGTATPNASSALEISSTTQGFLPPRMTQAQRDVITPVEGLTVYNTTTKKPNYYDGTEWKNYDGTIAQTLTIGVNFRGGKVAYILQLSDPGYVEGELHGLIAAPSDQGTGAQWGCSGTPLPGADGLAIGTGNQNTMDIVTGCTTAGIAAKLCYDLVLGGYNDWYLPSRDELNKLYINKTAIGGFSNGDYLSSSERMPDTAWIQGFLNGTQGSNSKSNTYRVRAIRAF
ncbi:MAG: DUF1566 domain-containing protein [Bacteroidales bacterium]|nr:DUF1566 domain-containing protein [Bacteroidales bacterium]